MARTRITFEILDNETGEVTATETLEQEMNEGDYSECESTAGGPIIRPAKPRI